ncbi:hypothetical protein M513_03194 [Trichuris suis]|uniref:Uncharacterized protein n=1 Tax=Trichuris suis TaxID=68888 RepID=A0A085MFS4_9BILA|nr:hypothetical protein M513_03194 [Trichuris suis]
MFAVCKYIHHRHYMYAVETLDITNTFFIGNVYHVYGVDTRNIPCIQLHLHLHDRYYLYVEETMAMLKNLRCTDLYGDDIESEMRKDCERSTNPKGVMSLPPSIRDVRCDTISSFYFDSITRSC